MIRIPTWIVLSLMVVMAALALITPAWAAEAPKDFKSLLAQAVGGLIPLYVPLLLIGLKKALEGVPPILLPGLALLAGIFGEGLASFLGNRPFDPIWGGAMGALGIAVRDFTVELQDFAKGAKK